MLLRSVFVAGAFGFKTQSLGAEQNIVVTTRSHSTGLVTDAVDACDPTEVIRAGGAGHKVSERRSTTARCNIDDAGGWVLSLKADHPLTDTVTLL